MGESPQTDAQGLAARRAAADAIDAVLANGRPLEEAMERLTRGLEDRDRALARMIASTVLRRLGTLRALVRSLLEKPLPASAARVDTLLFVGAAQIALMDVPDHAAVDTTVALAGEAPATAGFKGLVNAVLRRLVREGTKGLDALDPYLDVPEWLRDGWSAAYGGALAREIAMASRVEAPLDITAKADPALWRKSSAAGCCRPARSASPRPAMSPRCRASLKAPGGCRTPPRLFPRGSSVPRQACASPTCAPRPAARPRNWQPVAPRSPRWTAPVRA